RIYRMRASEARPKGVALRAESPNRRRGFPSESPPNVASTRGHAPVTEAVAHPAANGPSAYRDATRRRGDRRSLEDSVKRSTVAFGSLGIAFTMARSSSLRDDNTRVRSLKRDSSAGLSLRSARILFRSFQSFNCFSVSI